MSVIDGCEWSAWRVLAKKPPVEEEAEVNLSQPVWTQKKYRSSKPDSPVILVIIPIYRSKRKLRDEGPSWQLLWPERKRTELRDVYFLRSHNCELCSTVRAEREIGCSYGIGYHIVWDMFVIHPECWCLASKIYHRSTTFSNHTLSSCPYTGLYRPLGLQDVKAPRISIQSTHESGKVFSPKLRPPFPPQKISLELISVRGWGDPNFIVGPEGLCQWKSQMIQSGIEPTTFRLMAQ